MKIKELLDIAKTKLIENNIEDASIIARVLLEFVLKIDRSELVKRKEDIVKQEEQKEYDRLIKKIIDGIPIQYITKKQEFMKLEFYVDENVLIPQPDTEILVEEVLKIANSNATILDLCTGSGCIGISLASNLENSLVTMSDISNKALQIAKKNARDNNVDKRCEFIQSDLFEKIDKKYDIIVSNPPYIETNIIPTLSKQVQNEPIIALDGKEDGLYFYKEILGQVKNYLNKDGYLCMEIGYNQKEKVMELANKQRIFSEIKVIKDLEKNDRVIICKI